MSNGCWTLDRIDESKKFFYESKKDGEMRQALLPKTTLVLTHTNGAQIRLSRFRHQGRWKWRDSRKGSCTREHVVSVVARLGGIKEDFASELVLMYTGG